MLRNLPASRWLLDSFEDALQTFFIAARALAARLLLHRRRCPSHPCSHFYPCSPLSAASSIQHPLPLQTPARRIPASRLRHPSVRHPTLLSALDASADVASRECRSANHLSLSTRVVAVGPVLSAHREHERGSSGEPMFTFARRRCLRPALARSPG